MNASPDDPERRSAMRAHHEDSSPMKKFALDFACFVRAQPMALWFWAFVYGALVFMLTLSIQVLLR